MTPNALPSSWRRTTLAEVAAPVPNAIVDGPFGSNLKLSDYVDEGIPVLQGKNITNDKFRWYDVRFISDRKAASLKRSSVRTGDVLIVKIGSIGYAAIVDDLNGFDFAIIPANLAKVTPDATKVDLRYLHKWLTSVDAKRYLVNAASKTAQPALSLGKIRSLPLPLPPLPDQRRIAEVLDRAEGLRAKRRAALALIDTLTQSIFLDMFGDPATNPKGWPVKSLGELARERPNNGIFRKNPEYQQDRTDGLPVVWVEDLFRGDSIDASGSRRLCASTSEIGKYGLMNGDILFCRSSLKLDGIAFNNVYLGDDAAALFECHVIRISPNLRDVSSVFLNCMLRLPRMRTIAKSKSKTATMTTIDQASLCSILVPLPPIEQQNRFSRRVAAIQKLKAAHRASLAELDALFASLQHRAFRGEL